ncbi:survival protein SurE-like phosphatase/nucleotidase, partial [Tanacetum coccineum]
MTTKNNFLPPGLVSNLQDVLNKKNKNNNVPVEDVGTNNDDDKNIEDESTSANDEEYDPSKPVIFITNSDGIDSPGLLFLVEAIVNEGLYNLSVCAPQ